MKKLISEYKKIISDYDSKIEKININISLMMKNENPHTYYYDIEKSSLERSETYKLRNQLYQVVVDLESL